MKKICMYVNMDLLDIQWHELTDSMIWDVIKSYLTQISTELIT
jgi:hypothetical protein